jgi:hypothetical protein
MAVVGREIVIQQSADLQVTPLSDEVLEMALCQVVAGAGNTDVAIRSEPDTTAEQIGTVPVDIPLDVFGQQKATRTWYLVAFETNETTIRGWVRADLMVQTTPCPSFSTSLSTPIPEAQALPVSDPSALCQAVSREPNMFVAVRAAPDESADRLGSVPYGPTMDVLQQKMGHDGQLWFLISFKLDVAQLAGWTPAATVIPTTICPPLEENEMLLPLPTSTQLRMREIVVASRNIPAGHQITEQDVTTRWWPESSGVLAFTRLEDVIGEFTGGEIFYEQPILMSMVVDAFPTPVVQALCAVSFTAPVTVSIYVAPLRVLR